LKKDYEIMAETLVFEPGELEILETFDFEEEIQRPEESRFYTLEQQINDFFEKMLPEKKLKRHEEKELKKLRDRIKASYEKTIFVTDTDYVVNTATKIQVPWVHPVYSDFNYTEFSYKKQWVPLFTKEHRKLTNYYQRLIGALPKPYTNLGSGRPSFGKIVNKEGKNPIQVLGDFESSKSVINDDGSLSVVKEVYSNTADQIETIGYYLDQRPYDIPRSIDHPFLSSNKASFVESTVSLQDVYPSVESIMEHAIPTTRDPYVEGLKHLKLYGYTLHNIPWMAWKDRFFPAEYRDVPIPIKEIPVEKEDYDKPSETLLKTYSTWNPSYDPRYWLSQQIDGGGLVSRILLSEANSVGSLNAYPYLETITYDYPESLPEICEGLTKSFDSFLQSGVYRHEKKQCIPITTILQEKVALAYKGRTSWKETTQHEMIRDYTSKLKLFTHQKEEVQTYTKFEVKDESERRKDVLAILRDPERETEDKAEALEIIVRDLEFTDQNYFDLAQNFVMCHHTLELLRGILKDDFTKFKFYSEWTFLVEGARVCKFCGEEINRDNFIATKEYDSEGHLTMEYTPLNSETVTLHSLTTLKPLFDTENAGESVFFLLCSYLQIVPIEQQLMPILQRIRVFSSTLKEKAKGGKISKDDREFTEGLFGIAGFVVLIQTHNPFLIPKRKVGTKQFNSAGYPRDSDDPKTCQTLKSVIQLLHIYLKMFPALYKGGVSILLRKILKQSEDLEVNALRWIGQFYLVFRPLFEAAKDRYEIPEPEEILPAKIIQITPELLFSSCKIQKTGVSWKLKRQPVESKPIEISAVIPSIYTLIETYERQLKFGTFTSAEIRQRLSIGLSGFPFDIKTADSSTYYLLMNQVLTTLKNSSFPLSQQIKFRSLVESVPLDSPSTQRDILKGIFFELLFEIKKSAPLTRVILSALKSDLTFKLLLINKEDAEKQDFILRARERNDIKSALRHMTDSEREISQKLLSLGLSEFIVTNKMREFYFQEYESVDEIAEEEEYTQRDYVENGNLPEALDGTQMEVDYGDYGDRAVRDYNDYTTQEFSDDLE
jgi:hypothetical protein